MRFNRNTLAYTDAEIDMGRHIANNVDAYEFLRIHGDVLQRAIGVLMTVELAKLATVIDGPSDKDDAITLAAISDAGSTMIQILLHAGVSCDTMAVLDELLKSLGPKNAPVEPPEDDTPPVASDLCRKQLSLVRNERIAHMYNPKDVLERAYVRGFRDLETFTRQFLRMPVEQRGTIWTDFLASSVDD